MGVPMLRRDRFPDQLVAVCDHDQAGMLLAFDHHRPALQGGPAVLLTWHWHPREATPAPLRVLVVFQHAVAHPPMPPSVQAIIDTLIFHPPA
jgi:hypothetical protein